MTSKITFNEVDETSISKIKNDGNELITGANKLDDETKNKALIKDIEYFYYSKEISNSKDEKSIHIGDKYQIKLLFERKILFELKLN